jgi:NAD(P)H dehydrogenase (quinone)
VIVVTGSTGHVGGLLAEELAERGEPMRLLVRDPARAPRLPNAEVVTADYGDPDSLAEALGEGDRVFMVSVHEGPEQRIPLHRSFIEAATALGVAQIVYLSFVNASPAATFLHARSHGATEEMLEQSGIPSTSIRNAMYTDHIPGWFDAEGVAREPVADGRINFSYRPELAKAIAVTLTEPGHDGKIYDIVGPESVTLTELARIASEVTGATYRYEPSTRDEWEEKWRARGKPEWEVEAGLSSFDCHRNGELDIVSGDYRRLTGQAPLTVGAVIARHAAEMPLHGQRA